MASMRLRTSGRALGAGRRPLLRKPVWLCVIGLSRKGSRLVRRLVVILVHTVWKVLANVVLKPGGTLTLMTSIVVLALWVCCVTVVRPLCVSLSGRLCRVLPELSLTMMTVGWRCVSVVLTCVSFFVAALLSTSVPIMWKCGLCRCSCVLSNVG